jgi:hypothetical protein
VYRQVLQVYCQMLQVYCRQQRLYRVCEAASTLLLQEPKAHQEKSQQLLLLSHSQAGRRSLRRGRQVAGLH